jgi:hypothetical protein
MATFPWSTQREPADARKPARRAEPSASSGATPPRETPPPAAPALIELPFDVRSLVGAWRPGTRRLTLRTRERLSAGRRVALKLESGLGIGAPVVGTVREAASAGIGHTAVIEVDADREPILRRVFEYLEGRAGAPRERAPRYRMVVPVVVTSAYALSYMNTFSLSRGGCGIDWTGPRPVNGAFVDLRIGTGNNGARLRARVRWVRPEGSLFKVGASFLSGDDTALERIISARASPDVAT